MRNAFGGRGQDLMGGGVSLNPKGLSGQGYSAQFKEKGKYTRGQKKDGAQVKKMEHFDEDSMNDSI
eukprot:CAMPEP_0202956916 /NCGR_PEP_ID=MMETSP1396-20130829/1385_1 /ASSEMBLY_ACC=CAM_ASM_000872 /TAXON_ID= /ORGANISM="Pseudokeronopsis sp., Strain Brazil" /LENGTH=65 /DNA_ID=CAMNT_0049674149 /DNA_START=128 /DNA_END=325 /DNA_ORIENTATION=+